MTSTQRRWREGDKGWVSGIPYRIVRGSKSPDDLILQLHAGGEWRNVSMDLGFLLADFLPENEDVLYPDQQSKRIAGGGGDYYLSELWHARKHGWQSARQKLLRERAAKACRSLFSPRRWGG